MTWAGQVASAHSNHAVIVLTHTLLYSDDTLHGSKSSHDYNPHEYAVFGPVNGGTEVWDKFIRRHPNIVFTFNGHVLGPGLCATNGDYGNTVYLMAANYQHESNGGNGFLRILNFDPTQREVRVETYSPKLGQFKTDARNAFTLTNLPFFQPGSPSAPERVTAEVLGAKTCRVTWALPTGGADEVSRWVILRNETEVGISAENVWVDEGLLPNTTNRYRVRAFNPAGRRSDLSEEVDAIQPPESGAPKLVSATGMGSTNIVLVFDRPLNEIFATTAGNYVMGRGCAVLAARLESDERTVILTTTPRLPSERYPMKIHHLHPKETTGRSEDSVIRIVVQDRVDLLVEDFDDGDSQGWAVVNEGNLSGPCAWAVMTNRLWQTSIVHGPTWGAVVRRKGTYVYWNDSAARQWTDYSLQATFHATYDGGVGLMFRLKDTNNFYRFEMDNRFRFRKLFRMVNGQEELLAWAWATYPQNSNQVLRVEAEGSSLRVYLNGVDVFGRAIEDSALPSGSVGLYCWKNRMAFDDVTVQSLPSRIVLNDPPEGMTSEWIQRLVDADPDDEVRTEDDLVVSDDFDGDGTSNEEEFWAGTDPVNARSFFHLATPVQPAEVGVVLQWPSASNRVYMLMRSNKLCQGFQAVAEGIPSTAPMNTYTDHPPAWASLFYRVAVRP